VVAGRAADAQTVINFPSGFADAGSVLVPFGGPVVTGSSIQMTNPATVHQATNVWYQNPVNVQSFTTTFTFNFVCPASCGNGIGFMIMDTTNPDSPGYWTGYSGAQFSWSEGCTTPNTGDTNCVAINSILVKFDLFNVETGESGANFTGFYSGGEWPQPPNPEFDMSSAGINMESGDLMSATLAYDGTTLTETVTDTVTKATYTNKYTANIPSLVGGNTALVGFGAGTGAAVVTADLDSWTYTVETPAQAAAPTFAPAPGTYAGTQSVTLSSASPSTVLCYNTSGSPATNGTTGCTTGTVFSSPISVPSSETLYAVAGGNGYDDSPIVTANYVIQSSVQTPTFAPGGGTYTAVQSVAISDVTGNATIYYTTDGTAPTTSSTKYTGPITISSTETLKAIAAVAGFANSAVASAAYMINILPVVATPVISPPGGAYTAVQSVTISDSTSGATIYYTTDGSTPTTASTQYAAPISVSSTETIRAIAAATGSTNSAVATENYTISLLPVVATPSFLPYAGTYTTAQTVSISDSTAGATIYYTTDGTMPTTSSTVYSTPITVSSTETLEAIAVLTGYTNSALATAAYVISAAPVVATPTFSPAAGAYSSAQSVTISDTTSGATIYYTTNGTVPTTSSTVFSSPITVGSTETIQAFAVLAGDTNSGYASAAYTIDLVAPSFTLASSAPSLTADTSGTVTLTVTPQNGFNSTVSFACSGLPAGATCSFNPATVTPSGSAASTQLTVSAPTQSSRLPQRDRSLFPFAAVALSAGIFGWGRRRGCRQWMLLAIVCCGAGLFSGCGGSSAAGGGGGNQPPPTTATVSVTATSGSLQQMTTIVVTVN
jgi:hypothetical protein